jgi:probable rRNA maturation factor
MSSEAKICFFYQDVNVTLARRTNLKNYIQSVFKKEGKKLDFLNYIFCNDKSLLEINREFLNHDYYTDIVTFNLSETEAIHAEIYISIDRIRENAKQFDVSFKSELHRVIFHGVLHLCGYKDKTKEEKRKIRAKEDYYLTQYS